MSDVVYTGRYVFLCIREEGEDKVIRVDVQRSTKEEQTVVYESIVVLYTPRN